MSTKIPLEGSGDRDDNRFEKAVDTGSQIDYYVGNKDTGDHCHMYKEHDTGNTEVIHRGECAVCEDEKKDG